MIYLNNASQILDSAEVQKGFQERDGLYTTPIMRQLNASNIICNQYNSRMRYDKEILLENYDAKIINLNFNTQFQFDGEAKIEKVEHASLTISDEDRKYTIPNVKVYQPTSKGMPIESDEGIVIAEYFAEVNVLNVLFDLGEYMTLIEKQISESNAKIKKMKIGRTYANYLFEKVIKKLIVEKEMLDFIAVSWTNPDMREENIKFIKEKTETIFKEKCETAKNEIEKLEKASVDLRRKMVQTTSSLITTRKEFDLMNSSGNDLVEKILKEMDNILLIPEIKLMSYRNNIFKLITNYLPIYDSKDRVWEGGEYIVEINTTNSGVKIKSTKGKGFKGYWTSNDPHPHVNGADGNPCLGSAGQGLADLLPQHELFAITVLMIEYLKSVNLSDSAGSRIETSGRKLLSKEEEMSLTSYMNDKESIEVEIIKPIKKKVTPKKVQKVTEAEASPLMSPTPQVTPTPFEDDLAVPSTCVHCGVDVYTHGIFEVVHDVRNGEERIAVACRTCIRTENGFEGNPEEGFVKYTGEIHLTPPLDEIFDAEMPHQEIMEEDIYDDEDNWDEDEEDEE